MKAVPLSLSLSLSLKFQNVQSPHLSLGNLFKSHSHNSKFFQLPTFPLPFSTLPFHEYVEVSWSGWIPNYFKIFPRPSDIFSNVTPSRARGASRYAELLSVVQEKNGHIRHETSRNGLSKNFKPNFFWAKVKLIVSPLFWKQQLKQKRINWFTFSSVRETCFFRWRT